MKLIVKKENSSITFEGQRQNKDYSYGLEVVGIKSKEDIQEIIHQCELIGSQLPGELNPTTFTLDDSMSIRSEILLKSQKD